MLRFDLPPIHRRELPPEVPILRGHGRDAEEDDGVQRPKRVPHVRVPVPRRRGVVGDDQALE